MQEVYDLLEWWSELFVLPCLAEVAATEDDCARLARAGADFVAAGGSVWTIPTGPPLRCAASERRSGRLSAAARIGSALPRRMDCAREAPRDEDGCRRGGRPDAKSLVNPMKINGNEIRPGYVLEHNDRLWMVVRAEHVKPGKGPAYQQVELKDLVDGTKLNERFRAAETVERVRLEEKEFQFLYEEDEQLNLMDQETFEQMTIGKDLLGDSLPFLQEGMALSVQTYEGRPLMVHLPDTAVLEVVEADPVVKGQTAAASYKPAVLENGVRIMVPPHIEAGTRVVVNIAVASYVERARD